MSESTAQSDGAKRAAARKAKILARGNNGLAKLAQTARGDEADTLYAQDDVRSSQPSSSPAPTSRTPTPASTNNSHPISPQTRPNPQIPQDQQAMSAQVEAMMSMFGGGTGAGTGGMPDIQRLMAQMMGADPSGTGQNLLGDLDDPAGLGNFGNGQPPKNPFDFPGAAFPSFSGLPTKKKSRVERYFPLIHAVFVIILLVFVVAWWEPRLRSAKWTDRVLEQAWTERWALLAGRRGMWRAMKQDLSGGVQALPVFWAFTTLELILQTTRFFILNSPPPPHSLISTFLPVLPPAIARPLVTGSRYLTIIAQTYKDGCMLVFGLGMVAVLAEWLSGRPVLG
ncbi:MAG: hypothetical protein TREMPRED_005098 [Tremellales sp. Tagirdzhanova-0007]|nr:MAG: hypothetical protein TREMPRED_005098 [Tremellales sp. Tagirdzhanova-0007]